MLKIDYKFSTVCEKNEKMSGPLGGGDFFYSHCTLSSCMFVGLWFHVLLTFMAISKLWLNHINMAETLVSKGCSVASDFVGH